jgi:hypothetical protein
MSGEHGLSTEDAPAVVPDDPAVWTRRGQSLTAARRLDAAASAFGRAAALLPRDARAQFNLAQALKRSRDLTGAINAYRRAIALGMTDDIVFEKLAICELTLGDFTSGLKHYERRTDHNHDYSHVIAGRPAWTGAEDLAGRTILVLSELGLGDSLLFCRYLPLLEARGARVLFSVQKPLRSLMATLPGRVELVDALADTPDFDFHVRLMSLPHAFGTTGETIPAAPAYLSADPERVERWRALMGDHGLKVGVSWYGKARPATRRFPAAAMQGLAAIPSVRLINLQKGEGAAQLADLPPGMSIEQLGDGTAEGEHSFLDSAAIIEACDLVISCDTSIAHLAGALGRPVWIALCWGSCWRYLTERRDSPWYPSARLFRQLRADDWSGVFAAMEAEIAPLAARAIRA